MLYVKGLCLSITKYIVKLNQKVRHSDYFVTTSDLDLDSDLDSIYPA